MRGGKKKQKGDFITECLLIKKLVVGERINEIEASCEMVNCHGLSLFGHDIKKKE